MISLTDSEFGEITLSPLSRTNKISLKLAPNGKLKITYPKLTPKFVIKAFITSHREQIRKISNSSPTKKLYLDGDLIGKNHLIKVIKTKKTETHLIIRNNYLVVELAASQSLDQPVVQAKIKEKVIKILRKQAKDHLPHRLEYLAKTSGYKYARIRFSHASTRWGSCSNKQTISLNIGLMKLPQALIDYVLIHELCHTKHMNHSSDFWHEVGRNTPNYKILEKQLKLYSPGV